MREEGGLRRRLARLLGQRDRLAFRLSVSVVGLLLLTLLAVNIFADVQIRRFSLMEHQDEVVGTAWNVEEGYESTWRQPGENPEEALLRLASRFRVRALVLDRQGRVTLDSDPAPNLVGQSLIGLPEVASALRGSPLASFHPNSGFNSAFYGAVPLTVGPDIQGVVLVTAPARDFLMDVDMLRSALAFASLVCLALSVFLTARLARQLAGPLERMAEIAGAGAGDAIGEVSFAALAARGTTFEARHLAAALDRMTARLRALEAARQRFLADAAHELRTPAANIRALLEPLMEAAHPSSNPEVQEELMTALHLESERLTRLANDLLDLSELETGPPLRISAVEGRRLLEAVAEVLAPAARRSQVTVVVEARPGTTVRADARHLERALVNLLDNAIRHAVPGSRVTVRLAATQDWSIFEVENTGDAIPAEIAPHLFEPFFRLDASRVRRSGGSGLGLAIVREIAARHGGTIAVASDDRLTRFSLILPSRAADEPAHL
ncbi:MAG: HAMP domain-containing histidine kinase [Firmicutes bacterium]|nr:HAMP domain-containing histidine kinase [Bacillota bacterium]